MAEFFQKKREFDWAVGAMFVAIMMAEVGAIVLIMWNRQWIKKSTKVRTKSCLDIRNPNLVL